LQGVGGLSTPMYTYPPRAAAPHTEHDPRSVDDTRTTPQATSRSSGVWRASGHRRTSHNKSVPLSAPDHWRAPSPYAALTAAPASDRRRPAARQRTSPFPAVTHAATAGRMPPSGAPAAPARYSVSASSTAAASADRPAGKGHRPDHCAAAV